MTYQELCMVAKHEEKRQTELKKCQEYNYSLRSGQRDKTTRSSRNNKFNFSQGAKSTVKDVSNKIRCHKLGHVAANCKPANKEKRATGNLGQKKGSTKQGQVGSADSVQPPKQGKVKSALSDELDLLAVLHSSDSDGSVGAVSVNDQGSKPQYVNVTIQGVPTPGIIDKGADITIMGGELFKKIADAV